jgi:single-strand DNA-binding protein
MSEGYNQITLVGNLGADPELRALPSGQPVINFRIACTESYLDGNKVRQERTEWFRIAVFGGRATGLGKCLSKGRQVCVVGSMRSSEYADRNDGSKRTSYEVVAKDVILCGGGSPGGSRTRTDHPDTDVPPRDNPNGDDVIPF